MYLLLQHVWVRMCLVLCKPRQSVAGASSVVCSDGDSKSTTLAAKNVESNLSAAESAIVQVQRVLWGDLDDMEAVSAAVGNVDVVLGSDIVACPYADAMNALVDTLSHFAALNPKLDIVIASQPREAIEKQAWGLLRERFHVADVPAVELHPDFHGSSITIRRLRMKSASP